MTASVNNVSLPDIADLAADPNGNFVWGITYGGSGPTAISRVDVGSVLPMAHPLDGQRQRLRPDVVSETDQHEKYQRNAPSVQAGLYVVPRVIE